jgi:hypothetical protein
MSMLILMAAWFAVSVAVALLLGAVIGCMEGKSPWGDCDMDRFSH